MATTTDPVCGMRIKESTAVGRAMYRGVVYHFCCRFCQERFEADPEKYASAKR